MNSPPTGFIAPAPSRWPASWVALRSDLVKRWRTLAPRERTWASAAAAVIGLFLVWSIAIQPAWRTLRDAPVQMDRLEAQRQTMQKLAIEAAELRSAPPVAAAQAASAFQAATDRLSGRAKSVLQGDRATVTVSGVSGDELRNWLAEVRTAARARAIEVQLARDARGYTGTVVLNLGTGAKP
jgi:general secretion pathway protein M